MTKRRETKRVDQYQTRPLCVCGSLAAIRKDRRGVLRYLKRCASCYTKRYTAVKGPRCEQCGFVPLHRCQLDVDHIDGNHKNNDSSNLRTLCANCHRLVTHMQRMSKWAPEHAG